MCRKLSYAALALVVSLAGVAPVYGVDIIWDFESGNNHGFTLWSVNSATPAADDPTTAGDEALTGIGGPKGLPDAGVVWSIGRPDQYDGQKPAVSEGDKAKADGTMEYNQPGKNHPFTFPVNSRGQESYLNTYNLTQWGDNVHAAANDQIATSPLLLIGSNAQLTVWVHGGGNGTRAPELDSNSDQGYTTNSAGVAVLSAADGSLLGSVLTNGHGTLREDTIDLSVLAGHIVYVEVVDAFQGGWGWIAVDEIRITNAIELGDAGPYPEAWGPNPADGALHEDAWVNLSWTAGGFAVSHDVYLGDNFDDVDNGTGDTFRGNQTATFYVAGFPGFAYPDGLVPGTTYYWRIDEVNDTEPNSPWKGGVWRFSIPPKKAYNPDPADGAKFIATDATLSWTGGIGAILHTVYFGDNFDDVNNATVGMPLGSTSYTPGPLELEKTYYWRIDEFDGFATHKGDVWSFMTTLPGLGTIMHEWWENIDSLSALKSSPKYPDNPDVTEVLTQFSWDQDFEGYGARIHGWLYVPTTGEYTFWLNTDDNGELWLSTDDDPGSVKLIAQESTWSGLNSWGSGEEQSDPILLQAGNKYYVTALWQEGTGGDHCQVAWQGPGIPERMIIQGTYLSPFNPIQAYGANPGNNATDVKQTTSLSWSPGPYATSHQVYFGTDQEAVRNANTGSPEYKGSRNLGSESYDPGKLEWDTTYYWRLDEVNNINPDSPWVGNVWSFTTADFLIVDDFEDYDIGNNEIWWSWIDGLGYASHPTLPAHPGNGTGSTVGDETTGSYMEETIVHGGGKSMPVFYDNNQQGKLKYSEVELTLIYPRDWTEKGVKTLTIWFRGISDNATETLYVALNSNAVVTHDNPDAAQITTWTQWNIDLQAFADQGVNLANVNTIALGLGNKNNPQAGGSGTIYFDDIRLYWPAP